MKSRWVSNENGLTSDGHINQNPLLMDRTEDSRESYINEYFHVQNEVSITCYKKILK